MNHANTRFDRSRRIPAYVPGSPTAESAGGHGLRRQARQALGIPGKRPCHPPPVALFYPRASAAKWL